MPTLTSARFVFRMPGRQRGARIVLTMIAAASLAAACGGGAAPGGSTEQDPGTTGAATTPTHGTTKEDTTVGPAPDTTSSSPHDSSDLFFPTQEPTEGPRAVMEALTSGTLVVEKGCILLRHEDGSAELPVWPPGWNLRTAGREVTILDDAGRVVARVGDVVRMGGGQVTADETEGGYERLRQSLKIPEECPGPLWIVGAEVRTSRHR